MNYLYDGSFDGFLSCVWHHYYTEKADRIFAELQRPDAEAAHVNFITKADVRVHTHLSAQNAAAPAWQPDFICGEKFVETESEKADTVANAIVKKLSSYDFERVYRVFRTNTEDKEMKLLRYIALGFRQGSKIRLMHGDPIVLAVQKEEARIGTEVHRLCGLIRFSVVQTGRYFASETTGETFGTYGGAANGLSGSADGKTFKAAAETGIAVRERPDLLYAPIEPDNDVLEFLAPHFCARFHGDPFIIHDTKRGTALAAYRREWYIADFSEEAARALSNTENEENYRALWRRYFDTIAIKERTNPTCQRRFMPARYWKNLTEVSGADSGSVPGMTGEVR